MSEIQDYIDALTKPAFGDRQVSEAGFSLNWLKNAPAFLKRMVQQSSAAPKATEANSVARVLKDEAQGVQPSEYNLQVAPSLGSHPDAHSFHIYKGDNRIGSLDTQRYGPGQVFVHDVIADIPKDMNMLERAQAIEQLRPQLKTYYGQQYPGEGFNKIGGVLVGGVRGRQNKSDFVWRPLAIAPGGMGAIDSLMPPSQER